MARIECGGNYRVFARHRRAAIRFPVAASDMADAARFANETIPQLLPGLTTGTVVLQEVDSKERWSWEFDRKKSGAGK